jgi:hypothetical protein
MLNESSQFWLVETEIKKVSNLDFWAFHLILIYELNQLLESKIFIGEIVVFLGAQLSNQFLFLWAEALWLLDNKAKEVAIHFR